MRYNEILNEYRSKQLVKHDTKMLNDNQLTYNDAFEYILNYATKVASFINENCKPWLSKTTLHYPVYHGTKSFDDNKITSFANVINGKKRRTPKDSSKRDTKNINLLLSELGAIANRTNSVFVTGSITTTTDYGDSFVLIPINDFNYTWSSEVEDLYSDVLDSDYKLVHNEKNYILNFSGYRQIIIAHLNDIITNYKSAIEKLQKEYEDTINTETLYTINKYKKSINNHLDLIKNYSNKYAELNTIASYQDMTYNRFEKYLNELPRKYFDKTLIDFIKNEDNDQLPEYAFFKNIAVSYRHDDNSLSEAIKSNNEIMIHCEKYILLNTFFYDRFVKPLLTNDKPEPNNDIIKKGMTTYFNIKDDNYHG